MRGNAIDVAALAPGTVVAGWRLLEKLGVGGYGAVYLVEQVSCPGTLYVLKLALIPGDVRTGREAVFLMDKAIHPNVVRCHGCGHWPDPAEGHPFLVLEYVRGLPLHLWVEHHNPDFISLARVGAECALVLGTLHRRGVLHRDLKPEHILIRESDEQPVLVDFGVADHEGADPITDTPLPPGTAHLRSPEAACFRLAHNELSESRYQYGPADELYALGVCLYRASTGHDPFPPTGLKQRLYLDIAYRTPAAPVEVNPRVPRGFSDIIMRLLSKRPEERYRSGEEAHAALVAATVFDDGASWEASIFEWEETPSPKAGMSGSTTRRRIRLPPPPPRRPPASPAPAWAPPHAPEHARPTRAHLERQAGGRQQLSRRLKLTLLWLGVGALVLTPLPPVHPTGEVAPAHPPAVVKEVAHGARAPDTAPAAAPPSQAEVTPAATAEAVREEDSPSMQKNTQRQHPPEKAPAPIQPGSSSGKKAAVVATCLHTACVGAPVKPQSEDCPPKAIAAMRRFHMLGKGTGVYLDANRPWKQGEPEDAVFQDGPIVSITRGRVGDIPKGLLLHGYLYVSGDYGENRFGGGKFYGRYDRMELPDGSQFPICAIIGNADGMPKRPNSRPGNIWLSRAQPVQFVDRYVFE
jgi:eukaryotic-like serine/threonine-protein kinase